MHSHIHFHAHEDFSSPINFCPDGFHKKGSAPNSSVYSKVLRENKLERMTNPKELCFVGFMIARSVADIPFSFCLKPLNGKIGSDK